MTNLSAKEFDDYLREEMPTLYHDNGVQIGVDIRVKCFYINTDKYLAEWFWKRKTFRVLDLTSSKTRCPEVFSSSIDGDLSLFCQFDDNKKYIIHSSAEDVDVFIERLLSMRVFQ